MTGIRGITSIFELFASGWEGALSIFQLSALMGYCHIPFIHSVEYIIDVARSYGYQVEIGIFTSIKDESSIKVLFLFYKNNTDIWIFDNSYNNSKKVGLCY
ncbi:hypothetical protein [Candidatus Magnetobacterium casense]|uniref:Uncharacterized protein n=1 Tax=Candidatus Magnetobacterium casense TaxID=1455061 RepID=A0ABS6S158_9BACT|nr:hypothetical protein [Candidatus Magnetobacterium casensis]MBV6342129.1 hypothetical protein [Candidatus Magnetobacterium casensis]